jgi:D-sedoheptulose 7-phosphate isomerase
MKPKEFFEQVCYVSNKISSSHIDIDKAVGILKATRSNKKQVFICGNGGSAGNASHMTADLFKMGGLKTICLDDNVSLMTALINDDGWSELYVEQLKRLFNKGDILITLSVHGGVGEDKAGAWSQNINKAIDYVNKNGGMTIGIAGFDGGFMKKNCNVCILIPADTTPLIEAFQVVIHHYIAFELYEGNRK